VTEPELLGCADEPIRIPGAVQPHGALLAVTEPDLVVVVASANAAGHCGREVAGARLGELLGADVAAQLAGGDLAVLNPLRTVVAGREVDLVAHRADGLLVVELEPLDDAREADAVWHRRLPLTLQRLQAAPTLDALSATLAAEVRTLTGFDRVMVYRFDPSWNGAVVAEDRREDLEPFLGLRFPASDIPPQARALYLHSWLRLIPDARYTPVPLVPARNPLDGRPLDLAAAVLRSVSPVHLEYLANMGVVASMSVSLVDGGRLWGLIACHHYSGPHRPTYTDRAAAEFLGRTASVLLGTKVEAGDTQRVLDVADRSGRLVEALARAPRTPLQALTDGPLTLLDLVPAGGAAVRLDGRLHLLGETPPEPVATTVVQALLHAGTSATDAVLTAVPEATDAVPAGSGVLAVPVRGGRDGDFLAWFRPETLREVAWGGDPHHRKMVEGEHGVRLSPRRSFARYTETVRATSQPWRPHEVAAAEQLAAHLSEVTRRRAEDESRLAATLQRTLLLEQLPVVPGIALAARYAPSARDVVGGDWYDLVLLPSGRVSVVLGDVAGHGLGAAAITAQLRHALRAYLLTSPGPGAALARLNELAAFLLPEELATVIVAELDPATGAVAVANAGHLPVLLLDADGGRCVDAERGPALGFDPQAQYGQTHLQLVGDDRLVVFTDGLVERRGEDLQEALDRLLAVGGTSPRDPDQLLDALLTALSPPDTDDVTLLALGRS
jgi:light-regulated signal transduction histidine kinase (bacteriophytochrome)